MQLRQRSNWGWGYADSEPSYGETAAAAKGLAAHLGFGSAEPRRPIRVEDAKLPQQRVPIPTALAQISDDSVSARASHAYGRAYRDLVRGFNGTFDSAPDFVITPRTEQDVERALAWCDGANVAVIPFGGGTSVVGGVEARIPSSFNGAVSLDLRALDQVLEVDPVSRGALIQAGALGPGLEMQLANHGLTLRFYPQSFEMSTLGGWIATRAAGHFATGPTHIDDLVESIRAITPSGSWESRRLPASGAGVSPDRMLLGSEGTLGVITQAWVRVQPRPVRRSSASVRFPDFLSGTAALREMVQSGLAPANCRLIDPGEAELTFAGDGSSALLVLGFESLLLDTDPALTAALAICARHGGTAREAGTGSSDSAAWRDAFLKAPYLRDTLVAMGVLAETFETAMTWQAFDAGFPMLLAAATDAVRQECGGQGRVSCRITHVYPDGLAPYFTVVAPARIGSEVEQWDAIKRRVSDALLATGATITHHHAVGRDHQSWHDQQAPDVFQRAIAAAKQSIDPNGILNPR